MKLRPSLATDFFDANPYKQTGRPNQRSAGLSVVIGSFATTSLDVEVQIFLDLQQIAHHDRVLTKEEHQSPVCAEG